MSEPLVVVGVGADGWHGLSPAARAAIEGAEVLMGSARQLQLVPDGASEKIAWPSPLSESLPGLLATHGARRICVLASGDPTFHGIGTTLTRLLGAGAVRVIPHPSSVSLACARLGWPQDQVEVISLVGHPLELVHPQVQPGRRLVILSWGAHTPTEVAGLLTERGYGGSEFIVLEQLGSADERIRTSSARDWDGDVDPLNVIGVLCQADPGAPLLSTSPGLPDDAYESDGQLTKREVRAVTLSRLAPVPGQLLWDVGGGAGSIAIEWSRHHPTCRAVAIERDPDRAKRLDRNAVSLGVVVRTVVGAAPEALAELETPDAVFVGGGGTVPGVLEACWQALAPGGRLVMNGVTLETESLIARWYAELGGDLVRLSVQRASPVGGMTGWRPAMPVTIWSVTK
ncbi:precorrin-6y C5,15-methyltransferase (decarboxylating), CbiE subunit [Kribbella flavida DSM 17836]|uniref:Precorrin-6y C5,15-methyltransferase (Decarboxylating), CbiE subunit n=1 Tax=Kribbella flavida (strain DSM 17836 / JCM 10339 / NBRC 14399) TaxID=479435 RepID=D2Q4R1_KRIFD|nr:bifunctional cobalt-precorrin-7 (C(5))-methyltransferase/cobalt-precorrin-6B (C(15))-methyltransferase [Kribbella flavida]ADB34166.1 precorrin-6y C5,15-methyltransferase (decarboxylating), CbiE subunit [Kribbella flavida DSM 17836]